MLQACSAGADKCRASMRSGAGRAPACKKAAHSKTVEVHADWGCCSASLVAVGVASEATACGGSAAPEPAPCTGIQPAFALSLGASGGRCDRPAMLPGSSMRLGTLRSSAPALLLDVQAAPVPAQSPCRLVETWKAGVLTRQPCCGQLRLAR